MLVCLTLMWVISSRQTNSKSMSFSSPEKDNQHRSRHEKKQKKSLKKLWPYRPTGLTAKETNAHPETQQEDEDTVILELETEGSWHLITFLEPKCVDLALLCFAEILRPQYFVPPKESF